ncbi:Uncharacterised protein [Bacillus subtilis]|nr:Uncharacterised protein [Bacillus subtilis]
MEKEKRLTKKEIFSMFIRSNFYSVPLTSNVCRQWDIVMS